MTFAIVVPCREAYTHITPETRSTLKAFDRLGAKVIIREGISHLEMSRSVITCAVTQTHDAILWWDSDVVADDPAAVLEWAEASHRLRQVSVGIYPQRGGNNGLATFGLPSPIPKTPCQVESSGAGCMLIPREIVDRLSLELPKLVDKREREYWPLFQAMIIDGDPCGSWIGEDLSFCFRARLVGFPVVADPRLKLGHVTHDLSRVDWNTTWL